MLSHHVPERFTERVANVAKLFTERVANVAKRFTERVANIPERFTERVIHCLADESNFQSDRSTVYTWDAQFVTKH
eukprot:gene8682-3601_t